VFELLQQTLIEFYRQVRTEHCRGLTAAEIRSILLQLTMAIDVLHTEGYAHRDIKPENVLLERNMESNSLTVKLVDFGLTKKLNNGQNTNYIATRWYRAPELLLSLPYRANVDMFALGCLMAELYSGREVFRGVSSVDQLSEVCNWLGTPTHENWP
jgi:serine/threonine protein kinase